MARLSLGEDDVSLARILGLPADRQRAKLILRLLLKGSTPLVFQLCRLLEAERTGRPPGRGEASMWLDIAHWARRECLVDEEEAQVLVGTRATPADPGTEAPALKV